MQLGKFGKNKKMKIKQTIIRISLILTIICFLITIGGSFFMLEYALCPKNRGKDLKGSYNFMFEKYPFLKPYIDSLNQCQALRDTFIMATDGITRLHAYHIAAATPTSKTAIVIHGYTDNAIRMMMIGYMYNHDLGYNVLLPDLRYAGLSEGNHIQMGWNDRLDIKQWIEVANKLFGPESEMVVHGISMGAATTMMLAGDSLPTYVRHFIADCGYTSVWEEFKGELNKQFQLPEFPLLYTSSLLCKIKYGWSFTEASALNQVCKCTRPMLFIHGDRDHFVPTEMVYRLHTAKPYPKELWIVPETDHANAYFLYPQEYTQRVNQFLTTKVVLSDSTLQNPVKDETN